MTLAANSLVSRKPADRMQANRNMVRAWLYVVVAMLLALVVVGGATRMTNSGLSITEWKPIHGVVPPLNDAEWQEEFVKYQQIPQFEMLNRGMTVEGFKTIFWWEWAHRALARGIGFVFAVPLIFLFATRRIERALVPKLVGILALGALQGAVGWWMVASGLVIRTDVSQYRLATHLTLAAFIVAAVVAVARGLAPPRETAAKPGTQKFAGWLVVLVMCQIYLGGLVAGLDAGLSYNTWPLMDGSAVPDDLFVIVPWWRNFFENAKTVQFDHRLGAYVVLAAALLHILATRRSDPATGHARRATLLFAVVLCQALVGIATLVAHVPMDAALTHQGLALITLCVAANHWRATKGSYPISSETRARPS